MNTEIKALDKSYWLNLYPTGEITRTLSLTREEAENRCDDPKARQIEVRLVPVEKP